MNNIITGSVSPSLKTLQDAVHNSITEDQKKTDLLTYFKDPASTNKYSTDNEHSFIKDPAVTFPKSLAAEIEKLDYNYKMGFLEPISHMWISSGKTLFLWNYTITEEGNAVFRYDHPSELIENVDVVKTLTEFELVVSTKKHLYLHEIQYKEEGKLLLNLPKTIKSDGIVMSNLHSTNTRRVFMQGDDGHVYEMDIKYHGENGLICHTEGPLMKYLGYFFKSLPEVPAKSIVVDDHTKLLYILKADSSIHTVNIQTNYQPMAAYKYDTTQGTTLEFIHHVPSTESKEYNLMAVSNKGDRMYFHCQGAVIELKHTRPAPTSLPGSLLLNQFTQQTCDLSFYNDGIFAATLAKSERKYLVLTAGGLISDTTDPSKSVYVEDVYYEPIQTKIWSIIKSSTSISSIKNHYLKENLESPDNPARRISTLSASGITHYTKQRPIDYLHQVLVTEENNGIEAFVNRYGAIEACALGFLLACSSKHSPQVAEFLSLADCKDDGLLLYFARIVEEIWDVDILASEINQEKFKEVQARLRTLLRLVYQANIKVEKERVDLLTRSIEGISLVCFAHQQPEWLDIQKSLLASFTPPSTCLFSDFVSTEKGASLAKDMVLSLINATALSGASNNYNYFSDFLMNHCSAFLGEYNITYYKGMECLQGAINESSSTSKKTAVLELSLNHFRNIIQFMELGTLQPICHEYSKLQNQYAAVALAHAKLQTGTAHEDQIYEIIFIALKDSLDQDDQGLTFTNSLKLSNDQGYHYKIYNWLREHGYKELLVSLDTPLLVNYLKTHLSPTESLEYLKAYHHHREEFDQAIQCLYDLAFIDSDNLTLEKRVDYLQDACAYLPNEKVTKDQEANLTSKLKEAQIQLELYQTLIKRKEEVDAKTAAAELATRLLPAETLYHKFAHTHELYEQGLRLVDLMDLDDWNYAKTAYSHIIGQCGNNKEAIKSKILDLAQALYPSIPAFPVYIIYNTLQQKLHDSHFAKETLLQADVPKEIIQDAMRNSP